MPPQEPAPSNPPFTPQQDQPPSQPAQPPRSDYPALPPLPPHNVTPQQSHEQSAPPINTQEPFSPPSPQAAFQPQPGPQTYPGQQVIPDYQTRPTPYAPPKSGKRIMRAVLIAFGLALLTGAGAIAFVSSRATPDSVFKGAVETSLSTKHVRQMLETKDGSVETFFDVSRPADPRAFAHTKAKVYDLAFDLEQYATLKDSFVKYKQVIDYVEPGKPGAKYKDKWMQSRRNGKLTTEHLTGTDLFFADTYLALFGDWIFGNFSADDKNTLADYIINQKVYQYDASKVEKKQINGADAYVYTVTVDSKKRLELNKKVAAIWGIDEAEIEKALEATQNPDKITLYIDIKTKRLIQADMESGEIKAVNKYTDYEKATIPKTPTVQADYGEFAKTVSP